MIPPTGGPFDGPSSIAEIAPLQTAMARRDWVTARRILNGAEPVLRSKLVHVASDEKDIEGFLEQVLAHDRNDTTAAAVLGGRLINIGWEIRTTARAEYVSQAQFAALHDWLRRAEHVLREAAARNPADCAVWMQRLTTARGLQLGQSEARRRYDRLAAVDPHHLPGQEGLLMQLYPKWSGSWPQAHEFARECMLAAPLGAHQGVLVVDAHLEHILEFDTDAARTAYLFNEPVRAEIYEAAHHSVWHADFRRTAGWVVVMSTFALIFSVLDDQPAAASLFAALGDFADDSAWQIFGDPAQEFVTRRARAFAAVANR